VAVGDAHNSMSVDIEWVVAEPAVVDRHRYEPEPEEQFGQGMSTAVEPSSSVDWSPEPDSKPFGHSVKHKPSDNRHIPTDNTVFERSGLQRPWARALELFE